MDYKSLMGYGDTKKKKSKPKQNKVLESIKDEFNLNEGPAYEYKKHSKKIEKSLKDLQKNYLDFYEVLRKKGLDDEAADFLDNYKKNVVGFTKQYKKDFGKLL
jgi:aryl-alcohol dehydrogenase-like predicted oxidoreductase